MSLIKSSPFKIIGITGGIGSGKTTLCYELLLRSFSVYESDKEARRITNDNPTVKENLITILGKNIYVNGEFDRKTAASLIFADKDLLLKMNQIIHPAVKSDFLEWVEDKKKHHQPIVFIESAILFESEFNTLCTKTVLITAPEEVRVKRTMARDGITAQMVKMRIKNQKSENELAAISDVVLVNDGAKSITDLVDTLLLML